MTRSKTYVLSAASPSEGLAPLRTGAGRAGLVCCLSAAVLVLGCAVTQVVYSTTAVSDDLWRYPWSSTAFIVTTMLWAAAQAALIPAVLAFQASGAAGSGRTARWGLRSLLVGAVIGPVAHVASLPFTEESFEDNVGAQLVAGLFGIGALLSAAGFLLAGTGVLRTRLWTGFTRWTPLATGVWGVALLGLQFTPLLPAAVGVYYLGFLFLGTALIAGSPERQSS